MVPYPTSSPPNFPPIIFSNQLSSSPTTPMSQLIIFRPRCLISPSSPGYTYHANKLHNLASSNVTMRKQKSISIVRCKIGLGDFIGGDLVKFDLGKWLRDVEEHKSIAIYTPHEGGYEGRYLNQLRYKGYQFLDLTARGLGDPETTLTKFHPICPPHLGKQPIARWYFPPEVDYRLSLLPPNATGLVVWIIEAKVLSKAELQFLTLLPTLHPKVRVIAECGNWRKVVWRPLKEAAGLAVTQT